MRYLPLLLALACCASRPIDCGYRPHVRTGRDAEARGVDLSRSENSKIADLNDYEMKTELPDTEREFGIEDRVVVVHATVERISKMPDGADLLKLRDGDFRVLAYVPGELCSSGSVFAPQIGAVRTLLATGALHVGDSVIVRSLVFFDHVTPGGAAGGAALMPVLGVTLANSRTYGLRAVPEP
jgi:hypothetical protein